MAKILLVEDDNNLREIYEARLSAEGYEITTAQNGEEALSVAKQVHPDLVISDVMMPRISGFEMLDILRNTEELKHTKIIMLTALGQAEDRGRANNLGADKYLVKSQVTLEDIVKAAQALLSDDGTSGTATVTTPTDSTAPDTDDTIKPTSVEPSLAAPAPAEMAASFHVAPEPADAPVAEPPEAAGDTPSIAESAPSAETEEHASEPAEPVAETTVVVTDTDPIAHSEPEESAPEAPMEPTSPEEPAPASLPAVEPEPATVPVVEPPANVPSPEPAPSMVTESDPASSVPPEADAAQPTVDIPEAPTEQATTTSTVNDLDAATTTGVLDSATAQTIKDEEAAIESQINAFETKPVAAPPAQVTPAPETPVEPTETMPSATPAPMSAPEPTIEVPAPATPNDAVLNDALDKLTIPEDDAPAGPPMVAASPASEPVAEPPAEPLETKTDSTPEAEAAPQNITGHKLISPLEHSEGVDLDKLLAQEDAKETVTPQPVVVDAAAAVPEPPATEPEAPPKPAIDPNTIAL